MRKGSLNVIGTGYQIAAQVTPEALACLKKANQLFYLVYDSISERWLSTLHPNAFSLRDCWFPERTPRENCDDMVHRIMSALRKELNVCVAVSGHPGICVYPTREAIRRARREGFTTRMLPGVSAVDCLFADIQMHPGEGGYRIYEARHLLVTKPRLDAAVSLILLQIDIIKEGMNKDNLSNPKMREGSPHLYVLSEFLQRFYPANHMVLVYETSTYPGAEPIMHWTRLTRLPKVPVNALSTLLVPPRIGFAA